VRVTKQRAVELQIDASMRMYEEGNYPAAVTLAAAAEGAMPPAKNPSLWDLTIKAMSGYFSKRSDAVGYLNEARDWLKHYNGGQPNELDFEKEPMMYIVRAVSRFHEVYGREAETAVMQQFFEHARLDLD
jgi:hypothetical protein